MQRKILDLIVQNCQMCTLSEQFDCDHVVACYCLFYKIEPNQKSGCRHSVEILKDLISCEGTFYDIILTIVHTMTIHPYPWLPD